MTLHPSSGSEPPENTHPDRADWLTLTLTLAFAALAATSAAIPGWPDTR